MSTLNGGNCSGQSRGEIPDNPEIKNWTQNLTNITHVQDWNARPRGSHKDHTCRAQWVSFNGKKRSSQGRPRIITQEKAGRQQQQQQKSRKATQHSFALHLLSQDSLEESRGEEKKSYVEQPSWSYSATSCSQKCMKEYITQFTAETSNAFGEEE